MALPSAVVLYIHRSVNTVIEAVFCTTLFAAILQVQIHQRSIGLLKMLRKSCSGETAGAITQHPHNQNTRACLRLTFLLQKRGIKALSTAELGTKCPMEQVPTPHWETGITITSLFPISLFILPLPPFPSTAGNLERWLPTRGIEKLNN